MKLAVTLSDVSCCGDPDAGVSVTALKLDAAIELNVVCCATKILYLGTDITGAVTPRALLSVQIRTIRPASGRSIGRSTSASNMLNIAVSAPMPSAIVSTATAVNAGDLRSVRIA